MRRIGNGKTAKTIIYLNRLRENRISINPPRKVLIKFWLLMVVSIFFLIAYSYNVFLFITVPLLGFWMYVFNYFIRTWRAFRYSSVLVIVSVAIAVFTSLILGDTIRSATVAVLRFILDVRRVRYG